MKTQQECVRCGSHDHAKCELPSYRVYYEDGSSYVTSMAQGITLEDARKYFTGLWITQSDESSMRVVDVQNEPEDVASLIDDFNSSNHGWCLSCGSMLAQYDDAGYCDNCSGAT